MTPKGQGRHHHPAFLLDPEDWKIEAVTYTDA